MALFQQHVLSGSEAGAGESSPVAAILTSMFGRSGFSGSLLRTPAVTRSRTALRMGTLLLLWIYFRYRGDTTVLRVNCAALRPFAGLLSRREIAVSCSKPSLMSERACSASGDICTVSYYLFAFLTNSIVSSLIAYMRM
jgi:hypothetical protein